MTFTVSNKIWITDPTPEIKAWCRKNLVFPNPEYQKKARMHFYLGSTPRELTLYEVDGDSYILPFGCLRSVLPLLQGATSGTQEFAPPTEVDFGATVPLYDYQEVAVRETIARMYGILQSPAGSGKTQMGIALACALGVKTLWLTHTQDLLMQSKNRALQYIDPGLIGVISEGKVVIGKGITFATVQTLCRVDLALYKNEWDCIIVDECHRVAGTPTAVSQFSTVLQSLAARHKYGLSATVHRADGMIAATFSLLGTVVWDVPKEAVADKIMTASVLPVATGLGLNTCFLQSDGTVNYNKLLAYLTESAERNQLILSHLTRNREHYNLILSDRVAHLKYLMAALPPELAAKAVMIDGTMTSKAAKRAREQALEDMRSGKKNYLFATYRLAKEGLDIPRLDRLYLTTPQKDYAVIVQSVGRIDRAFPGKGTPVVYDYVDGMKSLQKAYKKRCTSYRKCGCQIID